MLDNDRKYTYLRLKVLPLLRRKHAYLFYKSLSVSIYPYPLLRISTFFRRIAAYLLDKLVSYKSRQSGKCVTARLGVLIGGSVRA